MYMDGAAGFLILLVLIVLIYNYVGMYQGTPPTRPTMFWTLFYILASLTAASEGTTYTVTLTPGGVASYSSRYVRVC